MDKILASLAEFASSLSYRDLPANAITASKHRMIDALSCAMGAYGCDAAEVGLSLAGPPVKPELAGRILGSKKLTAADAAAFVNSCLIRKLDLNDTIQGAHPSDTLGGLFAVAPQVGASGEKLITAMVISYEIISRLATSTHLREKGWDQGFGISVGTAAGLANMMGLDREAAQHAISITAVANTPMRATRAGQLSMWKGAATAYAVRNAVFGTQLAAAGMTGPEAPFTGRHGLEDLITGPLELAPFGTNPSDFFTPEVYIKFWPVAYSLQALVWAGIELRKQVPADQLAKIVVNTYDFSYRESGSEPAKWDPTTRETADHSIPYVLVRALQHGLIDQQAFVAESYLDPAIRPLMNIIEVRPDDEIDKDMQREVIRMRLDATDRSGKSYTVEIVNPLGHPKNPLSDKDIGAKFKTLAAPKLGPRRASSALKQWQSLESVANTKTAFDALNVKKIPQQPQA